jgi:hypothetical protein
VWGVTEKDESSTGKPTYAWLGEEDLCAYPLKDEMIPHDGWRVFLAAKFPDKDETKAERKKKRDDSHPESEVGGKSKRGRPRKEEKDGGETSGTVIERKEGRKKRETKDGGSGKKTKEISPVRAPKSKDTQVVEKKTVVKGSSRKRTGESKTGHADSEALEESVKKSRRTGISTTIDKVAEAARERAGLVVSVIDPQLSASRLMDSLGVSEASRSVEMGTSSSRDNKAVDMRCSESSVSSYSSYTSNSESSSSSDENLIDEASVVKLAVLDDMEGTVVDETPQRSVAETSEPLKTPPRRSPRGQLGVENLMRAELAEIVPENVVPVVHAVVPVVLTVKQGGIEAETQTAMYINKGDMVLIIPRDPGQDPVRFHF